MKLPPPAKVSGSPPTKVDDQSPCQLLVSPKPTPDELKIAILGAGITGLSLARTLIAGGVSADDVHLFEAAAVAGGLCGSKTVDGFTFDIAGGHILYSKDQATMDWMKAEGGGAAAFDARNRQTKIRWEDRWIHYPFENGIGDLPPEANFDCLQGYVDAWHRRKLSGSEAPSDFAGWIQWRFGDGIAKHFMDPYNEKIWKRDLAQISSSWVAGRVPDAPIDDILRSAVGIRTEGYKHQSTFYYPKKGGFQAITDHMAAKLAQQIRLNTKVTDVRRHGEGWQVNGEEFDTVVNTLALTFLPKIVADMPAGIAQAMEELDYNGLISFLVALDRPVHPDLSWIYLPFPSQGPANRVTYMSNYATANAPEGKTSFLVEITWPRNKPYPGKELEEEMIAGLVAAGVMRREEVLFTDRVQVEHAYVIFDHGFDARRAAALDWLEEHGLHSVGRFARFDYDNSDQCVIKARKLAAKLLEKVGQG